MPWSINHQNTTQIALEYQAFASILEFESMVVGISDLSLFSQPLTPQDREGKGKERESRMEEEDKMEKRGKCWTSRLGEALREEKDERGFRIFTANIPFSTRHPVEKRQFILVIDLAVPLLLGYRAFCFQKKGLSRNVKGRVGSGGQ